MIFSELSATILVPLICIGIPFYYLFLLITQATPSQGTKQKAHKERMENIGNIEIR